MKLSARHTAALAGSLCLALFLLAKMYAPPGLLIFSADGSGRGQGAILHAGSATLADQAHPARAGEAVEIYLTGLPVGPQDGLEAKLEGRLQECPAVRACEAVGVEVRVGGFAAPVLYLGRPPQLSRRWQLNARIPPGVAPGLRVPVAARVAGRESNQVTIAIR